MENPIEQKGEGLDTETESHKKAYRKASTIFDEYDESERIPKILEGLTLLFKSPRIDEDQIRDKLNYVTASDKPSFVEGVINAIQPMLDWAENYPEEYEQMQRENIFSEDRHIKVNDLVYYMETSDGNLHMHIAPNEHTSIGQKMKLLREGLQELATVVKQNPEIKEVAAASWIIAASPKLLKQLGFKVHGAIPEEARKKHFAEETREVHHASISRSTLLEKYL